MDTSNNLKQITRPTQLKSPLLQAVLLILASILLWWFVVSPRYQAVIDKKAELASINGQKQVFQDQVVELNKLVDKLQSSDSDIKLLDEALPLSTRSTKIALLLESFARSSSLEISQLNIQNLDKTTAAGDTATLNDPYKAQRDLLKVKASVSLSGNIDQFKNFLELLETSGRLIDISSLEVSSSGGSTKFNIDLLTYAYEPI